MDSIPVLTTSSQERVLSSSETIQVESKTLESHGSIQIESDDDFLAQGWPGAGNESDPFRIEYFEFQDPYPSCIEVSNTRVHFQIQHCNFIQSHWGTFSLGIHLLNVSNAKVFNNTFTKHGAGVFIHNSSANIFRDNFFKRNAYGIYFEWNDPSHSSNNLITNNTFYQNDMYFGHGENTSVLWNVFAACAVFDEGADNRFDYNFWYDYSGTDTDQDGIGDSPYRVSGSSPAQDVHPLMGLPDGHFPVLTTPIQIYPSVEAGEPLLLPFEAVAVPPGHITWQIDDPVHFSMTDGALRNATILMVGEYPITITITDDYGQSMNDSLRIQIMDNFGPRVNIQPFAALEWPSTVIFTLQLRATDPSGIDSWGIDDEEHFMISQDGLLTSRDLLSEGSYSLTVSVSDTLGHTTNISLTIRVYDALPFLDELPYYLVAGIIIISIIVAIFTVIHLRRNT